MPSWGGGGAGAGQEGLDMSEVLFGGDKADEGKDTEWEVSPVPPERPIISRKVDADDIGVCDR